MLFPVTAPDLLIVVRVFYQIGRRRTIKFSDLAIPYQTESLTKWKALPNEARKSLAFFSPIISIWGGCPFGKGFREVLQNTGDLIKLEHNRSRVITPKPI